MKNTLQLIFICFLSAVKVEAQQLVVDPALAALTAASTISENASYSSIKEKQKAIESLQAATVATVNFINNWQKKIYNGLLYVSSTVNNAYQVYEAYKILKAIYEHEQRMLDEGKKNPLALAFAIKFQKEMVTNAIQYYGQIQAFILKDRDESLLMDAGERTMLLNKVLDDLRVIEAYAASSYYKVHWAVINGIIKTLNPFGSFVNKDAQIVKDVLARWKY